MEFMPGSASDDAYMEGNAENLGAEDFIAGSASFEDDQEIMEAKTDAVDAIKAGIADAKAELQTIKTAFKGVPELEHKVSKETRQEGIEKISEGISSMSEIREKAKQRRSEIQQRIQDRMAEIKKLAEADKERKDFAKDVNANVQESAQMLE